MLNLRSMIYLYRSLACISVIMATAEAHQIQVSDMMCNGCEDTIQHELRHADGVKRVSANYIEGTVEIEGDDHLDLKRLVDTINGLGFTAT